MGSLAFEPADERRRKASLNAGSFAFKGGAVHKLFPSSRPEGRGFQCKKE